MSILSPPARGPETTTGSPVPRASLLRPCPDELQSMDFDQLQRYGVTAFLLDRLLADLDGPVHLLEVGANVLNVWPRFLDPARVRVTRCDVEPYAADPDFVLLERGAAWPFADDSFDAVVGLEVLEHVPPEGRGFLLAECLRVARRGAVLTCPNGETAVEEAEALGGAAYRQRRGHAHPFLSEHECFGLPREEEVVECLRGLNYPFAVFENAPLEVWLPSLVLTETLHEQGTLAALQPRVNQALADWLRPARSTPYRKVYVCAKTAEASWALEPLPEEWGQQIREGLGVPGPLPEPAGGRCEAPEPVAALNQVARLAAAALGHGEGELEQRRREINRLREDVAFLEATVAEREAGIRHGQAQELVLRSFVEALVESGPWKLLGPLRAVRQWLTPRGLDQRSLIPWRQLEPVPGARPGTWVSRGQDPYFVIPCFLPAGWVRIRYQVEAPAPGILEIFTDTGHGFRATECLERTRVQDGVKQERLVELPRPVYGLRLDPVDREGEFCLASFEVTPLSGPARIGRAWKEWFAARGNRTQRQGGSPWRGK